MISNHLDGIHKLAAIITIILFVYLLMFLVKLERTGCECAKDWRRDYIIFYCVYVIVIAISQFFMQWSNRMQLAVAPLTFAFGIFFVVFTLQYVHRLKREKCSCSDEVGRVVLYLVAAIDAVVFAIIGVLLVMNAILMAVASQK